MIYNQVADLYTELNDVLIITYLRQTNGTNKKINSLARCLLKNAETLADDLKRNKDHSLLYRNIKSLQIDNKLSLVCEGLNAIEFKAIIPEINSALQKPMVPAAFGQNLSIKTLKEIREELVKKSKLIPEFDQTLSKLSAYALGLQNIQDANKALKIISTFEEKDRNEAFAHWINANSIPLKDTGLSTEQLKAIAPHLHHVDTRDLNMENLEGFISSCTNAYHLFMNSPTIQSLKKLPLSLQTLVIRNCPVKELPVSQLTSLQTLEVSNCPIKALDVSQLKSLQELVVKECPVKELAVSQLTSLQKLVVDECPVEALPVSQLKSLQKLVVWFCPVKELPVSQLTSLQKLEVCNCPVKELPVSQLTSLQALEVAKCPIEALDVSQLTSLQTLVVSDNLNLTTLLFGDALPLCLYLDFSGCLLLEITQDLPQLPFGAVVIGSKGYSDFVVIPSELQSKPLKLLRKLGSHLLKTRHMPNVVWWDSHTNKPALGIDAGGLRRQLITSLCESLFKKGSRFAFTDRLRKEEEALSGKLPLLTDPTNQDSILNLQSFARLIAQCSTKEVRMGAHLPHNFYHALASLTDAEIDSIEPGHPLDEGLKKKIILSLLYLEDGADEEDLKGLVDGIALPVAIVAKELKSIPGFSLDLLRNNSRVFIDRVQGKEITQELLKAKMKFEKDPENKTEGYFDKFIENHPTKLKKLVELFTSCSTLGDDFITIEVFASRNVGMLPSMHTCSQIVEVPRYKNYTQFELKLLQSFQALGTFETA